MAKRSKRMAAALEGVDRNEFHSLDDAIAAVKERATAKFDETIEIAMRLGVDVRHSDQTVRGATVLPNGTGKSVKLAVFARGDKAAEAEAAGADVVGADDLAEQVQSGNFDFERVIATPDMMPVVGKLGRVLGPRGLMPNPKLGTVTNDVTEAVKAAKGGQVQFRAEKAGIVHAGIGKASFSVEQLQQNAHAFVDAINKAKPAGAKGTYIKGISVTSSMGPSFKVDVASALASASPVAEAAE